MATISEDEGGSLPESPESGYNESESEQDLRFHRHGHEISEPEGTDSDLGKEKPVMET